MRLARLLALALVLAAAGCATNPVDWWTTRVVENDLEGAVLAVDPGGESFFEFDADRRSGVQRGRCKSHVDLDVQVDAVMEGFERYVEAGGEPRITLFLHGGLVSVGGALAAAKRDREAIGDADFYPVFVNWNTGILSSYGDYLFRVRAGRRLGLRAAWSSPLLLLADVAESIGRVPLLFARQLARLVQGIQPQPPPDKGWSQVSPLPPSKGFGWPDAGRLVTSPFLLLSTPILNTFGDGAYGNMVRRTNVLFQLDEDFDKGRFGDCGVLSRLMDRLREFEADYAGGEWDGGRNRGKDVVSWLRVLQERKRPLSPVYDEDHAEYCMLERVLAECGEHLKAGAASTARCYRQNELEDVLTPAALRAEAAGNATACDRRPESLAPLDRRKERVPNRVVEIRLVAHSMGAIVANELLRRNPDRYFSRVIYLAAASTLRDFAELALPYLRANPTTEFHIVTLHPEAEAKEWPLYFGAGLFLPRGSLLDWLDTYLIESQSEMDRTLGSWNNVVKALPQIDYLEGSERRRIHVHGFGQGPGLPRTHRSLNDSPHACRPAGACYPGAEFWRIGFWDDLR